MDDGGLFIAYDYSEGKQPEVEKKHRDAFLVLENMRAGSVRLHYLDWFYDSKIQQIRGGTI